ncbi:hypothetical protein [Erwinia amylovora]|nr:hypothetical protein [Erwinia amylovora]
MVGEKRDEGRGKKTDKKKGGRKKSRRGYETAKRVKEGERKEQGKKK